MVALSSVKIEHFPWEALRGEIPRAAGENAALQDDALYLRYAFGEEFQLLQHAVVEFLAGPIGGGLHEGVDDRMGLLLGRGKLRLK